MTNDEGSSPQLLHLQPGVVFAKRYRVERLLAAGGMGAVYVVTHLGTERLRALKVMLPVIVENREARARFDQEARVGARIDSPYIVDVVDAGVDDDTGMPFLVMELLSGKVMSDLIEQRGRLPAAEVVEYLGQAARGLDRAHAAGVVHRDLKPENLFVCFTEGESPRVKILDFGIAKILAGTTGKTTQAGGTPLYMAPEQTSRSAQVSPATDIWALGLIAYTGLVGQAYWESPDIQTLYREILIDAFEPPSVRAMRIGVMLPPGFDGWFFSCVSRDPTARWQKASDAIRSLAAVLAIPFNVTSSLSGRAAISTAPLAHAMTVPSQPELIVLHTARPISQTPPPGARIARRWLIPTIVVGGLVALTAAGIAVASSYRPASSSSAIGSQLSASTTVPVTTSTTLSVAPSSEPSASSTAPAAASSSAPVSSTLVRPLIPGIPTNHATVSTKPVTNASTSPSKHRGSYEVE